MLAGVDRVATKYLWSRLTPEKCADIARAGHVVMADLQRREEAERLSSLGKLRPTGNDKRRPDATGTRSASTSVFRLNVFLQAVHPE